MGSKASTNLQQEDIDAIQKETGFKPNQIVRLYDRFTTLDKNSNGFLRWPDKKIQCQSNLAESVEQWDSKWGGIRLIQRLGYIRPVILSQEDFLRVPELAINPLCDNIIRAFFSDENESDGVNFRQFVRILARFRPVKANDPHTLNSREEKLRFAFQMYDLNRDGNICRDELLKILHMMVGANISEEQKAFPELFKMLMITYKGGRLRLFQRDELAQLGSIADRTITEADGDNDGVITFEEFVKIMEKVDIERKLSIRFLS